MKKVIIARNIIQAIGEGSTMFNRRSISFSPADTSEEILNIHGVNHADLIITDESLPLMGGVKLCTEVRSHADLKYVSIVMVCENDPDTVARCREAGANVVLPKPLDTGALLWKASELLLVPQRKDMRVLLQVTVKGMEGNSPFFAQSQDISISGMLLETEFALRKGDELTCAFHIGHSEVSVSGTIQRVEVTEAGRFRCGMKFMNCSTKTLVIIEHFVKTRPRR